MPNGTRAREGKALTPEDVAEYERRIAKLRELMQAHGFDAGGGGEDPHRTRYARYLSGFYIVPATPLEPPPRHRRRAALGRADVRGAAGDAEQLAHAHTGKLMDPAGRQHVLRSPGLGAADEVGAAVARNRHGHVAQALRAPGLERADRR